MPSTRAVGESSNAASRPTSWLDLLRRGGTASSVGGGPVVVVVTGVPRFLTQPAGPFGRAAMSVDGCAPERWFGHSLLGQILEFLLQVGKRGIGGLGTGQGRVGSRLDRAG